jgi:hypothetical protein
MPITLKDKFPAEEGWIRAVLDLKSDDSFTEEMFRKFAARDNPEALEIGKFHQEGKRVLCYYRNSNPNDLAPMATGDLVEYRTGKGTLAAGCGTYPRAVVVSTDPFILCSEEGDMVWSSTVKRENFKVTGEAGRKALINVIDRLHRDLQAKRK